MKKSPYIIAEIGSTHDGSLGIAINSVRAAAASGANCVKFQCHLSQYETLPNAPNPPYFDLEDRYTYFIRTAFSREQWSQLAEVCHEQSVELLVSPFSLEAVDLLESFEISSYKIPSGEVTNHPLLEKIASTHKPVYLSSGMSTWAELDAAVNILKSSPDLTILQCSSVYPCPPQSVGLNVIKQMKERYKLPVGLSDHTLGVSASILAVSFGATVIEKHFTLSRLLYGSDAKHSLEPADFHHFSRALNEAQLILNSHINKDDITEYMSMRKVFQKSIVSKYDLPAGHVLTISDLAFKKPGEGISPSEYRSIIGLPLKQSVSHDTYIIPGFHV